MSSSMRCVVAEKQRVESSVAMDQVVRCESGLASVSRACVRGSTFTVFPELRAGVVLCATLAPHFRDRALLLLLFGLASDSATPSTAQHMP